MLGEKRLERLKKNEQISQQSFVGSPSQTECFNYIRFLQTYNHTHLYTCGTYAFQPKCTFVVSQCACVCIWVCVWGELGGFSGQSSKAALTSVK